MRRCLLVLSLFLLSAPAAALAGGFATTGLSSTPDGLRAGQSWNVELTILQHGRTPLPGLQPAIVTKDADGFETTFRARPATKPGHYVATVKFPRAGQWSYLVRDGFNNSMPTTYPAVMISPGAPASTTTERHPDPVGPPALPIIAAGALALVASGIVLVRRRRHPGPPRLA